MPNLKATLELDSNPFKKSMREISAMTQQFSERWRKQAEINIDVNSSGFARKLQNINKQAHGGGGFMGISGLTKGMAGAAVAGGAAAFALAAQKAAEFAGNAMDAAGSIDDLSDRTGISAGTIQEWGARAKASGTSVESVVSKVEKLASAVVKVRSGSEEGLDLADSFERMGVSVEDLKTKNIEQIFSQIDDYMRSSSVSAQTMADSIKLFGKGAGELTPFFKEFKGGEVQIKDVEGLAAAGDAIHSQVTSLKNSVINKTSGAIKIFADMLTFGGATSREVYGREQQKRIDKQALLTAEATQEEQSYKEKKKAKEEELKEAEKRQKEWQQRWEREKEQRRDLSEKQHKIESDIIYGRLKTDEERIKHLEKERDRQLKIAEISKDFKEQGEAKNEALRIQKEIEDVKRNAWKNRPKLNDDYYSRGMFLGASMRTITAQPRDIEYQSLNEIKQTNSILTEIKNGQVAFVEAIKSTRGGSISLPS